MLDFVNVQKKKMASTTNPHPLDYRKDLKDMALDSFIVGGVAFFSVWDGTMNIANFLISFKALGISFFAQLVYERGIKKSQG